jgi:hypothetical protein
MATDLYYRTIAFDYGDQERNILMREVWAPTPFMIDAYTGPTWGELDRDMREWCRDVFGGECFTIGGREGRWQRGGATIHGWTWYGFSTEEELTKFLERWPTPETVRKPGE